MISFPFDNIHNPQCSKNDMKYLYRLSAFVFLLNIRLFQVHVEAVK